MTDAVEPNYDHLDTPEWHAHAAKMNAWSANPDKDKIRKRAKAAIQKRIAEIVEPFGFQPTEQGTGWSVTKHLMDRGLYVQPSRGGDRFFINLSKRYRYGWLRRLSMPTVHNDRRLGHFYDTNRLDRVGGPGELYYWDIEDAPHYVDQAMQVLKERGVPWMLN